jgi:hypothetical protein
LSRADTTQRVVVDQVLPDLVVGFIVQAHREVERRIRKREERRRALVRMRPVPVEPYRGGG